MKNGKGVVGWGEAEWWRRVKVDEKRVKRILRK